MIRIRIASALKQDHHCSYDFTYLESAKMRLMRKIKLMSASFCE